MRNMQKQQILNCIESLYQAHEEIRQALNRNEQGVVQNMLSECQEFAAAIRKSIGRLEGERHVTMSYLEGYYKALFDISKELEGDKPDNNKICERLRREISKIENSVESDIHIKKEVVFLPYKACMWDSLESVWKAAREDENTDAYVIPIPYFDKNADGSVREFHYEGTLYPACVPVINYYEYDFEKRRPDIVFIHNPYDGTNFVTSVHPFFYAENLRKYTDKLVYIPYFVLREIEPDDQAGIDRMKHFCFLPGVIYAHTVIVQSEKMRQIYINEFIRAAKEHGLSGEHTDRGFLEKKILGLGSPKMDKVINMKKEEMEVPQEWLRLIQRRDGSRKRIIFYNTGIQELLKNTERTLFKMERVFKIFYENRDRIALLWRPHPLTESTLASMRPQMLERYQTIRARYVQANWGIYDDTPDIDRAIAISDAYYGDFSSVVYMCREAGKPILIQDTELLCTG